jgi:hypothetical protein
VITIADIPSATTKPVGAKKSLVRRALVQNAFDRRTFTKSVILMAGTAALVTVEGGIRKMPAFADTAPTHSNCDEYVAAQVQIYGQNYANGTGKWWAVCNPHAGDLGGGEIGWGSISNAFCNADGYHRQDLQQTGPTTAYKYYRRATSCGNKNAWAWKVSLGTAWQNKHSRRCSDGQQASLHNGDEVSRHNTACKTLLPGYDPNANSLPFGQYTPDGCDPNVSSPAGC